MFAVIIANFNETWWLVHGAAHMEAIISAREPPEMAIQLVTCNDWASVIAMWDEPEEDQHPWAINPRVIARLKLRDRTVIV